MVVKNSTIKNSGSRIHSQIFWNILALQQSVVIYIQVVRFYQCAVSHNHNSQNTISIRSQRRKSTQKVETTNRNIFRSLKIWFIDFFIFADLFFCHWNVFQIFKMTVVKYLRLWEALRVRIVPWDVFSRKCYDGVINASW